LELQEKLVDGGFLEPSENLLSEMPFSERMEKATGFFYEYLQNYEPELISPQHQEFYEAALQQEKSPSKQIDFSESQNNIRLEHVADILAGLSKSAFSYRVDAVDNDYLNDYFRKLRQEEEYLKPDGENFIKIRGIRMDPQYLRAWK